ncbi:Protein unc-13 like D [Dissostichus eleginoides]|uniref:Protein unc-13 like D n=1 Tax=Dissostichus eleginoides TaxID=100907 RepID=A0AAD9EX31_DISEL|nr:Protein unc-13 like D [Dissostichus eleginoides]
MSSERHTVRKGDNLLQTPDQGHGSAGLRQLSPSHSRKLGVTRKMRERRDLKEDENPQEKARKHKERELKPLYKELLYTITHKMGKPSTTEIFTENQLHQYIKEAFTMTDSEHESLAERAEGTEPPVYCLMATVKEAKGILGKDVSGFSDPYCIITVMEDEEESRTRRSRSKPSKSIVKDAVSDDKIFQSDIKKQTLNPIWNQTFILEFEDFAGASFHLEMWDKDEAVSLTQKLEDIKSNFNSLRRMIKEAQKEKGTDDFLGKVVLKLQDLHCTEDNWYNLEPRTETYPDRGQCHLNLKFIHKARDGTLSAGRSPYINYCGILQQFVQAYISKQQAQTLLEFYATQNDLSPFLQDLAKWVAYSKLYQSLEVDSSVLLQQLTSVEYHWHQQELPNQQKQELGDSLHGFLKYGLCLVSKYRDIFPPDPQNTPKLHTLLRILVQICKTQAFQKLNPAEFELHDEVSDAILDLSEIVSALSRLIAEVQEDIKHNKDAWNRVFVSAVQVDVFTVVYKAFDYLLAKEMRDTLSLIEGQMEQTLANNLFPVYLSLQNIQQDKAFLQKRGVLELTNFQEGFREALPYWLNHAFSTTQDRLERLQPLQSGSVPVKHSSSAVDLVALIQPICQLWEKLSWPDPEEAFMLMDVCKIVVNYCNLLKERVRELSENSDHGSAINMLCVVVNDLEHLRLVLTRLPTQLNWAGLRDRTQNVIGENQFHNTLPAQLQQAKSVLGREIRSALDTLGKQLNTDIETHVRNMSTRKRIPSKSTEDAADPLMRYLEQELHYMNENLVQENFNSLLTPLWINSVKILHQVAAQHHQHHQQEGLMVFCQRLLYTLQCLEQCFLAEGNGLPLDILHSDEYKALKAHLSHNSLSSWKLVEKFLEGKVWEQEVRPETQDRGLSDPFVQLCLEPNHIFPEVEPRCTQIKNCDLNPLFDEAFEFLISLEQCQASGACLVVTVFDHDTLRTDDFEGEAFLGLKAIPGVAGQMEGNELSLHPDAVPAQIRLSLMHPKPNDDNILRLLESRRGEREAQAYAKKRRQREKQSQEGI